MIREILTYKEHGDFLTEPCDTIPLNNYRKMFDDLTDTIAVAENCAGLALNQIGYQYTGFAMKQGDSILYVMNPLVVKVNPKKVLSKEGCLSLPNKPLRPKMRHKSIKIEFFDPISATHKTMNFKCFDAFVVQHEMDHGKGISI